MLLYSFFLVNIVRKKCQCNVFKLEIDPSLLKVLVTEESQKKGSLFASRHLLRHKVFAVEETQR